MNTLAGLRILVVEDEALIAMLIEDTLGTAGAQIAGIAANVREALRIVELGEFDLAVVDMNLAGQSSAPVASALAARRIPFLIASGYGSHPGSAPPGTPILAKPFETDQLVRAVAKLAGR